jgi:hypothetical protein
VKPKPEGKAEVHKSEPKEKNMQKAFPTFQLCYRKTTDKQKGDLVLILSKILDKLRTNGKQIQSVRMLIEERKTNV